MFPYIHIFGAGISTYGLCALVGIFAAGIFVCKTADKKGYDNNDFIVLLLISSIGVLVGGHILYGITNIRALILVLTNWSKYIDSFTGFLTVFAYIFGGSVFYGGLLGGMLAGVIYIRKKGFDLAAFSDIVAPAVPLFHCFGRIGCFLGGCCYGVESHFGFTVHGNELNPSINDVQRFPVQLLEAALNLALFFLIAYLLKKDRFKGGLFALYLMLYAVIRFFDEFLRGDAYRGFLFGLSTSQIISVLLFVAAGIYLLVKKPGRKKTAEAA